MTVSPHATGRRGLAVLAPLWLLSLACAGSPSPPPAPVPAPPTAPARAPAVEPLGPGVHDVSLGDDVHGEARTARVIWPKGPVKGAIWIFHGGRDTEMDEMAPKWRDHRDRGYVLVFPQGQRARPEEGVWFTPLNGDSPHLDPIMGLHERLTASGIDHHVATGFSSGAHMTWRLACQRPEGFHAFVPVGHFLRADLAERCQPQVVRPVLLIAMEDDPVAPYAGREGPDGEVHNLGAARTMAHLARVAHCRGKPQDEPVQGGVHQRYRGCELEHLRLAKGGHHWPGRGADQVIAFAEAARK